LNLKHIYLYYAPVYFVFILRHYVLAKPSLASLISRLFAAGLPVIAVFSLSFGPFIYLEQLNDVLQRLFPFKRGLSHAYWAPNFWSLYNGADKVLSMWLEIDGDKASMTGGLVREYEHSVLPSITPMVTFALAILFMLPALIKLFIVSKEKSPVVFLQAYVLCGFTSFMFGW